MAYFYLVCGHCEACTSGHDSLCRNLAGWVGVHRDGGYAAVHGPARAATPFPIPAVSACRGRRRRFPTRLPRRCTSVRPAPAFSPGDRVAVIGAGGGVGIHMVEMAALFGAQVAGLEASESKFDVIRQMGGTPVLSRSFDDIELSMMSGARAPPTVVIDLLGSHASLTWALRRCRSEGGSSC